MKDEKGREEGVAMEQSCEEQLVFFYGLVAAVAEALRCQAVLLEPFWLAYEAQSSSASPVAEVYYNSCDSAHAGTLEAKAAQGSSFFSLVQQEFLGVEVESEQPAF